MLKRWFTVGLVVMSVGCSNVDSVIGSNQPSLQVNDVVATSLGELQALPVVKKENAVIHIESNSQRLSAYGIDSRVAVYQLPTNNSVFKLTIRSYYDAKVFAPSALVVNSEGMILAEIPNSDFEYKPAGLLQTFRQEAEQRINVTEPNVPVYVIVYTTDLDKRGKSSIWVRQESASGTQKQEVKIKHTETGRVALEFDAFNQSDTVIISEDNGLELKTIDYSTTRVETLFDDLRAKIQSGDTTSALRLVDEIQKL
ncbi:MalM family protein [Vibrio sp. FNV 38]|nr:MalM family protein [Vibrio sp. FNV 38]